MTNSNVRERTEAVCRNWQYLHMVNLQIALDGQAAIHYQQWLDAMGAVLADVERVSLGGIPNPSHTESLLAAADKAREQVEASTLQALENVRG